MISNIYIEPQKNVYKYTCPHCNTVSQMDHDDHRFKEDTFGDSEHIYLRNVLTIHRCKCCGRKILWVDDKYIYPDIIHEEPYDDMPISVKQLYREAALISNKSPRAACALLRLAIDRLCNELGETDPSIDKNIAALVKRGVPKYVQQALDVVRVVGNKAVHPGVIAFDVDDKATATMLMHLINVIVDSVVTEPNRIDGFYQNLPETIRKAIVNRDK